jgi:transposase InsO family protein
VEQLHKRFNTDQVKSLLVRYLKKELKTRYLLEILGIKRRRFFKLVCAYRKDPKGFCIDYPRNHANRSIDPKIEENILKELSLDKKAIESKDVPLKNYNYSYVKDRLLVKHRQKVSLATVIRRAKDHGFYFKNKIQKIHDRLVLTNYAGELIQHDASFHLWAPDQKNKWCLITSLDDYSRFILHASLSEHESLWKHIQALEGIVLKYGLPFSFYVDSHSIFRFVRGRDEIHYRHHLLTDESNPRWKKILEGLGIKVIYALSPQAKGKIERPYRWLQDHLVRTCVRQNVKTIGEANRILGFEVHQYNFKRLHSTTGEIPFVRFQRALDQKQSLFREFKLMPPYLSAKDIFCLQVERITDPYCRVRVHDAQFQIKDSLPRQPITLKVYPLTPQVSEVRFWLKNKLLDVQRAKNSELKVVHF